MQRLLIALEESRSTQLTPEMSRPENEFSIGIVMGSRQYRFDNQEVNASLQLQ